MTSERRDDPLLVALVIGATVRATRLVVRDHITDRPRRWVQRHASDELAYLVGCPWCASFYVGLALGLVALVWPRNRAVRGLLAALTASEVAALVSVHLDPEDPVEGHEVTDVEPAS